MPVIKLRSKRVLLLFLMATSLLTVLTQSINHSFISLSQTSILLGLIIDSRFVLLANELTLPSRFSNTLLLKPSSFKLSILRCNLPISSVLRWSSSSSSSFLDYTMDLFMPSILNDLICYLSCSSISWCSFSICFILFFRNQFSWVIASSLEQSLSASSLKMTISFYRYCMRSLEENIFYCSYDLCLISASSFFILVMWLRQAYRNSASCFFITCSTFLSISSMARFKSRQAYTTLCCGPQVMN